MRGWLLSQLNEFLKDYVIASNIQENIAETETVETHKNDFVNKYKRPTPGENSQSLTHVTERNFGRKEVDKVVAAVKNRVRDAFPTAVDSVVIPRVEMAFRSIIRSSGHGPHNVVQNLDR